MKRLTLLLILAFAMSHATSLNAKSLVLVLSDSTRVYFLLDTTPVMKFQSGKVTVEAKEYAFTDIARFYISQTDDPTGIESQLAKQEVKWEGGTMLLQGKQKAEVYSTGGVKQEVGITVTADMTFIDTNPLPKGTYILKAGKTSMKFMKK